MKKILIIANLSGKYYFEAFLKASNSEKVEIHIFDPELYPQDLTFSICMNHEGIRSGVLETYKWYGNDFEKSSLKTNEISLAWYIREDAHHTLEKANDIESRFSLNESRGALWALMSVLQCRWINKKSTMDFVSSNKLYQQQIAGSVGLRVPNTTISNDPEVVSNFASKFGGLLLKPIGYIKLDDAGEYFLYAQIFSKDEIDDAVDSVKNCPVFAQEYVEKKYEYRVMAIGDSVLACKIDSQASEKTKIDWRNYDFDNVAHTKFELPFDVRNKILAFMVKIDLRYGAIDMIETPSGEFVFLEVNPSGQWGWIHDLAELPIPEAVARMLEQ